ncbi:hypothetical protein AB0K98_26225 [Streptomyces werraensis]|uniref:hypothetical protein n=1 Tax=Streptomyces werraensis TaxID=68284 RepID=UPI00343DEE76
MAGALVGAGGAVAAAAVTGRGQNKQWRRQTRRDAYVAFLTVAMATHQLLDEIGRGIIRASYADSERSERLTLAREQIGKLESARIVVSLEGPASVTQAAYEVWRSCSEWHKKLQGADPDALGVELTRSCIWCCQGDAEQCLEDAHEACRLAMVR